jgi:hypothetical protein
MRVPHRLPRHAGPSGDTPGDPASRYSFKPDIPRSRRFRRRRHPPRDRREQASARSIGANREVQLLLDRGFPTCTSYPVVERSTSLQLRSAAGDPGRTPARVRVSAHFPSQQRASTLDLRQLGRGSAGRITRTLADRELRARRARRKMRGRSRSEACLLAEGGAGRRRRERRVRSRRGRGGSRRRDRWNGGSRPCRVR